jgi:ComF family protein
MNALDSFYRTLLDVVYPPHCLCCGASWNGDGLGLCPECDARLERITAATCGKCGHQLAEVTSPAPRCRACEGRSLFFERAVAPCRYEGSAREMILRLKLGKRRMLAGTLSRLLIARIEQAGMAEKAQAIVPVPLHWWRRLRRGFNQSELLAEGVAEHFGLPLLCGGLRRVVATPSQTRVSAARRMEQLRGAFRVSRPGAIRGKTLLLIDDVMTTGATAAECSRVLRDAGAKKVLVATVARTMLTPPPEGTANAEHRAPDSQCRRRVADGV